MAFKRKFAKKRSFKKRSFKKRFARKPRRKFITKKGNIATSTETIDLGTFTAVTDTSATAAILSTTSLSQFPRSDVIANNYRFYRCTKLTYDYMPEANLYLPGLPTAEMLPRMIWVMCRDGNFNGAAASTAGTVGDLNEMGGKYKQFTKPVKISYTPNVCLVTNQLDPGGDITLANHFVTRKKMPWLSTVSQSTAGTPPNSGDSWSLYGHQWAIVCDSFATGQIMGRIKLTAHFEYKLPLSSDIVVT